MSVVHGEEVGGGVGMGGGGRDVVLATSHTPHTYNTLHYIHHLPSLLQVHLIPLFSTSCHDIPLFHYIIFHNITFFFLQDMD